MASLIVVFSLVNRVYTHIKHEYLSLC